MLRILLHESRHLRESHVFFFHELENVERGDDAVPGGCVVEEDQVSGLFSAEVDLLFLHAFDDIAVSDRGDFHLDPRFFHGCDKPHVAHAGDRDGIGCQFTFRLVVEGAESDDAVSVDHIAVGIGEDDAVGVAVERDADVRLMFPDQFAHLFGMGGAAVFVDVCSIRSDGNGDDLDSKLLQDQRCDIIGGTVGTVENRFDSFQASAVDGAFGKFNVSAAGVFDAVRLADFRRRQGGGVFLHQLFDAVFDLVGKFESVGAEDLDAVVVGGVVRRGDHDPDIRTHGADQMRDRGSRHRTDFKHIHSHAEHAAGKSRFQHISGKSGVLADDGFCRTVFSRVDPGDRLAYLQCNFRGYGISIRFAADSVCSE